MLLDKVDGLAGQRIGHVFVNPAGGATAAHVADSTDPVDDRLIVSMARFHLEEIRSILARRFLTDRLAESHLYRIAGIAANDLVILDVRTPEEFAEGHLAGAIMIHFYDHDFADQLAELDPAVPYLVYCRSGSRSGQTTALMKDLGFTDVADVDGGILAWTEAGLATTKG